MGIWKITEPWQELLELYQNQSAVAHDVGAIQSDHRKGEWLAVRLIIKHLLGEETRVSYHSNGAPLLHHDFYHISISHTKGYAAVILSPTPWPGIDIEYRSERAWKLRTKYLCAQELSMFEPACDHSTLATLCWCAKETAFKILHETAIDFIKHLHIEPFALSEQGLIPLKETKTANQETYLIHYQVTDEYIITWQGG